VSFKRRPAVLRRCQLAQAIGEKAQRPARRDGGIQLADRTRCGVARVDESLFAEFALARIERLEVVAPHVDLAAHLQDGGHRPGAADGPRRTTRTGRIDELQHQRDLPDRAHVLGDVLAGLAVAARGGQHQHTAFVAQAHGQTVELQFGHVADRWIVLGQAQFTPHPGMGTAWRTLAKASSTRPPTRRVGESSLASSGWAASSA